MDSLNSLKADCLDPVLTKDGVYVRFFPFHLHFRNYPWGKLTKSFVRQYSPISEYGGWGLHIEFFGKGTAFNVSGDKGLKFEFTDNKNNSENQRTASIYVVKAAIQ